MNFKSHQEFFAALGDAAAVNPAYAFGLRATVEDLYQHFKDRLIEELAVQSDCLPELGDLVDLTGGQIGMTDKERERFERWAKKSPYLSNCGEPTNYQDMAINQAWETLAWESWQAALAFEVEEKQGD